MSEREIALRHGSYHRIVTWRDTDILAVKLGFMVGPDDPEYHESDSGDTFYRLGLLYKQDLTMWLGATEPSWQFFSRTLQNSGFGMAGYFLHEWEGDGWDEWVQELYGFLITKWPFCTLCNKWTCDIPNDEDGHGSCPRCDRTVLTAQLVEREIGSPANCRNQQPAQVMCNTCVFSMPLCAQSGLYVFDGDGEMEYLRWSDDYYCTECLENNTTQCEGCNEQVPNSAMEFDGDSNYCRNCWRERFTEADNGPVINEWDYRPRLSFFPPVPTNPKKPLYLGIEIEVQFLSWNWEISVPEWLDDEKLLGLVYAKTDGSVDCGCEFVTHPMEARWALANFPFKKFDELIAYHGAYKEHNSCGTHIHMSKDAFTNAHLWKFLQLHYRLTDFIQLLGGREGGKYASFTDPGMTVQRERLLEIAKKKDRKMDYSRYVAVNLRNEYTVELRYPAPGTDGFSIKKNIELALALYEFSDHINIKDVRDGVIDDPGYLMNWIKLKKNKYPNLREWMVARTPVPKSLPQRES